MSQSGYLTKLQTVEIAGAADLHVRSLLDRRQYHDPEGAARRLGICSASWPLFGLVWPSGIELAARLSRRPVCSKERILEIGCGLGLPSLVGHKRGARITASDRHPLAKKFLKRNASLNGLSPVKYRHGQWGVPGVPCLIDTDAPLVSGRYDLIIGSDLLYDRDAPEALARFIDNHAMADAEVWIMDANRGYQGAFTRHLMAYGFRAKSAVSRQEDQEGYRGRKLIYQRKPKYWKRGETRVNSRN